MGRVAEEAGGRPGLARVPCRASSVMVGGVVMVIGYGLLVTLEYGDTQARLVLAMIVIGLGLGLSMQVYTLIVQNAVVRRELGTATAAIRRS